MGWKKIISSPADTARIHDMLSAIDKALEGYPFQDYHIHGGFGGRALYFFFRFRQTGKEEWLNKAVADLGACISHYVNHQTPINSLYYGASGVFWLYNHMIKEEVIERDSTISNYFYRYIKAAINLDDHDLLHGYIGSAVSLLDFDHPDRKELLRRLERHTYEKLGDHFELTSYNQYGGQFEHPPEHKHFNLGMAHGLASVLAFLSHSASFTGLSPESNQPFLGLVQKIRDVDGALVKNGFRFNAYYGTAAEQYDAQRIAWCYCDVGISFALLHAAVTLQSDELKSYSYEVARSTTNIPSSHNGIKGAFLCHGYSGAAHLYARLYNIYGDEAFLQQSFFYVKCLLQCSIDIPNEKPGFLDGTVGLGLALISLVDEVEPGWDRLMLLS